MTSLLDIGPLTEEVAIGTNKVTVRGVTPEGFFYLLAKFPTLREIFDGRGAGVDMAQLQEAAPGCVADALAVATTDRSIFSTHDEWRAAIDKASKIALNLPAHYQMAIFQAAVKLTFPEGIGPFMQAVGMLADSINQVSGQTSRVQGTKSSRRSHSGFTTDSRGLRLGKVAPSGSSAH